MDDLMPFVYEDVNVRTLVREDGSIWFVAKDVCDVLELKNTTMALENISKDDLSITEVIDSLGRKQNTNIISEPGLYKLIFRSRQPNAEKFTDWVTREVLPSIRKTGAYCRNPKEVTTMDMLEFMFKVYREKEARLLETEHKLKNFESRAEKNREQNRERVQRFRERKKGNGNCPKDCREISC